MNLPKGTLRILDCKIISLLWGDPDQSIYAFRDAQAINFKKMKEHYKKIYQDNSINVITLEENYRSTSDILNFSEKIMRQQDDRLSEKPSSHKWYLRFDQFILI